MVREKKPRVAIIAQNLVPYHAPLYQKISANKKLDVTVYYCDMAGIKPKYHKTFACEVSWDEELLNNYQSKFLKNFWPSIGGRASGQRFNPTIIWHLLRQRYDFVLLQNYTSITTWLVVVSTLFIRTRILFRGEGNVREGERKITNFSKRCIIRLLSSISQIVFYSCSGNYKYFLRYGCNERKLHLMHCCVDNEFFNRRRILNKAQKLKIRDSYDLSSTCCLLVNVGRFDTNKRQMDLIEATDRVQSLGKDVGLIFVGDGPLRRNCELLVEQKKLSNVKFCGFLTPQNVCHVYSISDIAVLCSGYDYSPKTISEAVLFDLPVISTDNVGTIGDMICPGKNALVYQAGDVDSLTKSIQRLIDDVNLRRAFGHSSGQLGNQWSLTNATKAFEDAVVSVN